VKCFSTIVKILTNLGDVSHPSAVGDNCHDPPSAVPDNVLHNSRGDSEVVSPVVEMTPIDDVVLGVPFHGYSPAMNTSDPPTSGPDTAVAPSLQLTKPQHHWVEAGCTWDGNNWSCSYDAVFMSFWFIYRKSSPGWRNKWKQQAPKWNTFFGKAFDSLLTMAQSERSSQAALSQEFTSFREMFRDDLSQINPVYFPRHGQVPASVCRIFCHIFSASVEREPHLKQVVVCGRCDTSTSVRCSFALIGSNDLLDFYRHEDDVGPFLPLQTAMTRYIERASQEPNRTPDCHACSGPLRVESLSMPETTWLWIELCDPVSPITPSPRLVFGLKDQRQVYTLQAVIYIGGVHFTARLLDQSSTWWKYDGMWRFGAPRADHVKDEVDLLENDDRRAAFLVYCRVDCRG